MCGIAGILYAAETGDAPPVSADALRRMAGTIAHRGPDAEGIWSGAGVGLAHRRLSIIDLAGGDQPLSNEDGSVQVVYNGEIYNFRELRRELAGRGHRFRTNTDTEVLVHLYEEMGDRLVERLRGMFAFALWDDRRRQLVLARDRVGQKPLYYYRDGEKLVFGSEIKAILACGKIDREVDLVSVEDYLTYGVIPGERSIFRSIRKLPPAHVLTVRAADLSGKPQRYWRLSVEPDESRSLAEWNEALKAKIDETVESHTFADVPVGAFLSGGIDSSAVVATLAAGGVRNLKTFSIGFHEEAYSELPYAREVARQYGTEHVEEIVTPEAVSSLDDLVQFYDEPFADSSAIPTMAVARVTRQYVKVALSGDGGDEAFGGYSRYAHDLREASLRRGLPIWVRKLILRNLGQLWPKADWLPRVLRAKTALTNLALDADEAYANTISICRQPLRRSLLHPDVRRTLNGHRPETFVVDAFRARHGDPLSGMISADVGMLLPDDFLTKVDRASMAVGLEVRPPFVDHELLELAARLPSKWKVKGGETKWLLKQLFEDRLPAGIVRRRKQGFELPVDEWLRGPLREPFESIVLAPTGRFGSLFDVDAVKRLQQAHVNRTGRYGPILWSLLVMGRWMECYLPSCAAVAG